MKDPEDDLRRQLRRDDETVFMIQQVLKRIRAHVNGSDPLHSLDESGWQGRPL